MARPSMPRFSPARPILDQIRDIRESLDAEVMDEIINDLKEGEKFPVDATGEEIAGILVDFQVAGYDVRKIIPHLELNDAQNAKIFEVASQRDNDVLCEMFDAFRPGSPYSAEAGDDDRNLDDIPELEEAAAAPAPRPAILRLNDLLDIDPFDIDDAKQLYNQLEGLMEKALEQTRVPMIWKLLDQKLGQKLTELNTFLKEPEKRLAALAREVREDAQPGAGAAGKDRKIQEMDEIKSRIALPRLWKDKLLSLREFYSLSVEKMQQSDDESVRKIVKQMARATDAESFLVAEGKPVTKSEIKEFLKPQPDLSDLESQLRSMAQDPAFRASLRARPQNAGGAAAPAAGAGNRRNLALGIGSALDLDAARPAPGIAALMDPFGDQESEEPAAHVRPRRNAEADLKPLGGGSAAPGRKL